MSEEAIELTVQAVRRELDYNPEKGRLVWRVGGKVAGKLRPKDGSTEQRILTSIGWVSASELVWFINRGEMPARPIVYKDGNPSNILPGNLKLGPAPDAVEAEKARMRREELAAAAAARQKAWEEKRDAKLATEAKRAAVAESLAAALEDDADAQPWRVSGKKTMAWPRGLGITPQTLRLKPPGEGAPLLALTDVLRYCFTLEGSPAEFRWKAGIHGRAAGTIAGSKGTGNTRRIVIDGVRFTDGELAWVWHYGEFSKGVVYRIDAKRGLAKNNLLTTPHGTRACNAYVRPSKTSALQDAPMSRKLVRYIQRMKGLPRIEGYDGMRLTVWGALAAMERGVRRWCEANGYPIPDVLSGTAENLLAQSAVVE
ncbi:hypothetical protein UFOVP783_30 [uncultured Caudovirales phage]|uniref:HNH nuclease n=1 Tax=uncultured Caudovirales phage TaxID=2100421 RepID=A0A6J5NU04_9CAUD|nr:hypothetical protein UFOVP783_30 [uncultured Caudovirales phage]